jgi:hypothetical protein
MVPSRAPVVEETKPFVFRSTPPRPRPTLHKIPAVFLMIVGGVGILANLSSLVVTLINAGAEPMLPAATGSPQDDVAFFASASTIVTLVLFAAVANGLVLFGGYQMFRQTSYNMAIAASILAMVPCSFGFLVGLPIGIWSLVILSRADVKAGFK